MNRWEMKNERMNRQFGVEVKKRRERGGMGQIRLSKLSGVSQPTISKIESLQTRTKLDAALRLATVLDISLDSLKGGSK